MARQDASKAWERALHGSQTGNAPIMPLHAVENEVDARHYGRTLAKLVFNPAQWKRLPLQSTDSVDVYEIVDDAVSSAKKAYVPTGGPRPVRCVRAIRTVRGSLDDVVDVLSATYRSQLFARLVPHLYASGGCVSDYGVLTHPTGEQEFTNVQFAMHQPQTMIRKSGTRPLDHQLFLEYTLTTQLQRTREEESEEGTTSTTTSAVPSVLYVLRPVLIPAFSARHAEYEANRVTRNDFTVTYVVQQTEDDHELSVEVVVTCALAHTEFVGAQALVREVVALSALQELINRAREAKGVMGLRVGSNQNDLERPSTRMKVKEFFSRDRSRTRTKKPLFKSRTPSRDAVAMAYDLTDDDDTASIASSSASSNMSANATGCAICEKRFHAFRWKKRCEMCQLFVCDHCLSTIANLASMRSKKRVCKACIYGNNANHDAVTRSAAHAEPVASRASGRMRAATDAVPKRMNEPIGRPSARRFTTVDPMAAPSRMAARPSQSKYRHVAKSLSTPIESSVPEDAIESGSAEGYSFFDATEPSGVVSDDEFIVNGASRSRRAKTLQARGSTTTGRARASTKVSARESASRPRGRSFTNDHEAPVINGKELLKRLTTSAPKPVKSQVALSTSRGSSRVRQLKTPPVEYELDFNWLQPFPKTPAPVDANRERERVNWLESQLKLDAQTAMMNLRRDPALEELTQKIIRSVATQWDGCGVNFIDDKQVVCLAYCYKENVRLDELAIATISEDLLPRAESASAYALYHKSAFFVADLQEDVRLNAHPLHTDGRVRSYLSLPIFATQGRRSCIGTLDLWKFDPSEPMNSQVSQDWWLALEKAVTDVAEHIEEISTTQGCRPSLVKPVQPFMKQPRSIGSSGDSRSSTFLADSLDLDSLDLEEPSSYMDGRSSWTVGQNDTTFMPQRPRRHTDADQPQHFEPHSYGSSAGRSSTSSIESTLETLLERIRRTSEIIEEQNALHTV
ncbi:hypothetical protein Poli38472_008139 [Pythium oligandrum]|uniref:FYVE-type domain-containing protein n=1 Tax=Pythium oligandrum TaxID=41045 RepID=A0A8K1CL66_PYTOL|nr:hypothetical protein Poli38472_008139 [Pythium oligandrum]|eukprot:TMW65497.1 hypothetical protein Poli38472_008139 [Pythium oligandrum]